LEFGTKPRFHKSGKYVGVGPKFSMMIRSMEEKQNLCVEILAKELRSGIQKVTP
jgi:hypothetical protein